MTIKPAPSLPFETFLAVQLQDRGSLVSQSLILGWLPWMRAAARFLFIDPL
jgi:hypothetical protein